jgi:hypothetical protein
MSKAIKIEIYKMVVKPVAALGSETQAMAESDMKRMDIWERKFCRRI